MGSFNRLRFFTLNSNISTWEQTSSKEISNIYTITALSWSRDGTKLVCSGLSGAVLLFEFGKILCTIFKLNLVSWFVTFLNFQIFD